MLIGPIFTRELVTAPRRPQHFVYRGVYGTALFVLMCTAWLVLAGTQIIRNVGDMAKFGSILFLILAPLQLALLTFLAALRSASGVAQEKDKKTILLLLMTRLTNHELVLGKLLASLLDVLVMLATAAPIFMLLTLFGGVSLAQVGRVFRRHAGDDPGRRQPGLDRGPGPRQDLSIAGDDGADPGDLDRRLGSGGRAGGQRARRRRAAGIDRRRRQPDAGDSRRRASVSRYAGPVRGRRHLVRARRAGDRRAAQRPGDRAAARLEPGPRTVLPQGRRRKNRSSRRTDGSALAAEAARAGHVDARVRTVDQKSREVWDNPVLWREMCTWAYGRKVLVIKAVYWLLFAMAALAVYLDDPKRRGLCPGQRDDHSRRGPAAGPVLSGQPGDRQRPGRDVDHQRARRRLARPAAGHRPVAQGVPVRQDAGRGLCHLGDARRCRWCCAWSCCWPAALTLENLLYLLVGLAVMDVFVIMLGIHCGLNYANSQDGHRRQPGQRLLPVPGRGDADPVHDQLQRQLSRRSSRRFWRSSSAAASACSSRSASATPPPPSAGPSLLLPFATFFAITNFLVDHVAAAFLVTAATYGFTTAAMLVPALYEFDIAMGRTKIAGE